MSNIGHFSQVSVAIPTLNLFFSELKYNGKKKKTSFLPKPDEGYHAVLWQQEKSARKHQKRREAKEGKTLRNQACAPVVVGRGMKTDFLVERICIKGLLNLL